MRFLEFLGGFVLGLGVLAWVKYRTRRQIDQRLRSLNIYDLKPPTLERLSQALESQQQSHQLLVDHLATWQHILHAAPLAFIQVDEANHLLWLNQQAEQLLDIDRRLIAPEQQRLLLQVVRSYELDRLIRKTRDRQVSCQTEWLYHPPLVANRGGQTLPLRGYGLPLALGHVGVFLEDRREATLLKAERERWASDVAHELKTPLTSIRLVVETLQPRLEPGLRIWADRLLKETLRLGTLVQDLLELNHLSFSPTPELNTNPVDFPQLVQSVWANLEPLAQQKQVTLDYQGETHCQIQVNESQFFRVLLNLLDNSLRYSPNQSTIQVQLSQVGAAMLPKLGLELPPLLPSEWLHLQIIDAGGGFSPEDLPHIFERFYRGEASRVRQPDQYTSGSGLGLAIVQQIIVAHDGQVIAGNHPDTGGGWLQVFLPIKH